MAVGSSPISNKVRDRVWKLHKEGLSNRKIGDRIGCSDRTIARIIEQKQREEEMSNGHRNDGEAKQEEQG